MQNTLNESSTTRTLLGMGDKEDVSAHLDNALGLMRLGIGTAGQLNETMDERDFCTLCFSAQKSIEAAMDGMRSIRCIDPEDLP